MTEPTSAKILDGVFKVATGLIILAIGYVGNELTQLRRETDRIEAGAFTKAEARELERSLEFRISELKTDVTVIREILERMEKQK